MPLKDKISDILYNAVFDNKEEENKAKEELFNLLEEFNQEAILYKKKFFDQVIMKTHYKINLADKILRETRLELAKLYVRAMKADNLIKKLQNELHKNQ